MRKMFLMLLMLLIVSIFLVSCTQTSTPEETTAEKEFKASLDEELSGELESPEDTAVAGQAYAASSPCDKKLTIATKQIKKLNEQLAQCQENKNINCGTDIFINDFFSVGDNQFQYKGADAMTKTQPKIKFKDMETGETIESRLELRALTRTIYEGVRYHFWSDSDYNVDDFVINLAAPCDNEGTACLTEINHKDEFVIGGDRFQYMGADKVTKTEPKIKFKNLETGETLEMDLRLVAVSHFLKNGRRYHFESDSGADYNVDDFRISLFHPCD